MGLSSGPHAFDFLPGVFVDGFDVFDAQLARVFGKQPGFGTLFTPTKLLGESWFIANVAATFSVNPKGGSGTTSAKNPALMQYFRFVPVGQ